MRWQDMAFYVVFTVLFVAFMVLFVVVVLGLARWATPASEPAPYITVEVLELEFTEREYRDRVQGQIERDGWGFICVQHLLSRTSGSEARSVNSARQNLVYAEECAQAEDD